MSKKPKDKKTKKITAEISIEDVINFCSEISMLVVDNYMDEKYDDFTAIVGLEVISQIISKRVGLCETARKTVLETAQPAIDNIIMAFQDMGYDDDDDDDEIVEILRLQADGSAEKIYAKDTDNECDEKIVKKEKSRKKVEEKQVNPKARVKVGPPIIFSNYSRFRSND